MEKINCLGDACPLPVIKTKRALKKANKVEVLVDNLIATQNLVKMAEQLGGNVSVVKENDNLYHVFLLKEENSLVTDSDITDITIEESKYNYKKEQPYIVVCSSEMMGAGETELSKLLIKSFLYALTEQDVLPEKVLLYNKGIYLGLKDSETVADLHLLEQAGVDIMSCGLCADYYGVTDDIEVGTITNMYAIIENMRLYPVVKPS
ncbi:sulfurtransferase-like selenium metabolism protein YedF [Vagococcus intermedius]|uniref:Sulfurtransferase-like selenium metabolism protein YedF n=1 Tax=Vagococcus intermedius TaxID=2991418 RepID=A0AAF0CWJ6_9ENTE|nr:sulfurtransferase-like selenium metabolism protein YedF [Vagococcus intermedius]WEG74201.1 sulfurtransferase-like selenium metabolism protein YedF [Vagococcus intermedius]WEG76282.1 sulfurtransferase-like selenium metabolism protein YedF [Vagococcus intermedius]